MAESVDLVSGWSLGDRVHAAVVVVVPEKGSQEDVNLASSFGGTVGVEEGAHQLELSARR
jgi:hypothetical protein